MERTIEPEWLDILSASSAGAIRSRRDLRLLNLIMGHGGKIDRLSSQFTRAMPAARVVDLGAGDGWFTLNLVRRLQRRTRVTEVILVDQVCALDSDMDNRFRQAGCPYQMVRAEVMNAIPSIPGAAVIVANLFLHHLAAEALARLFHAVAQRASLFVACEPRRSTLSLAACRLLRFIGCCQVTRHDAERSVRAGFTGTELSKLWPVSKRWHLTERSAGLFSHVFLARRCDLEREGSV